MDRISSIIFVTRACGLIVVLTSIRLRRGGSEWGSRSFLSVEDHGSAMRREDEVRVALWRQSRHGRDFVL